MKIYPREIENKRLNIKLWGRVHGGTIPKHNPGRTCIYKYLALIKFGVTGNCGPVIRGRSTFNIGSEQFLSVSF